jgi:glycosyltransferase involved in cell wall biosynthesis
MDITPIVSIGMPVYNSELYIGKVIETFLNQTFTNFELIISDNASTDKTDIICLNFAKNEKRIKYFRQIENQGALVNFKYVLDQAKGIYFMWAASDDFRDINFLSECVAILENNPTCVAATSYDSMIGSDDIRKFEAKGDLYQRLVVFLNNCWNSHGFFYSLIRINILKTFDFKNLEGFGADWSFMVYLISHGELHRSSSTLTQFGISGVSNSDVRYSSFRNSFINWIIPHLNFSFFLIQYVKYLEIISGRLSGPFDQHLDLLVHP